MVELPSGTVTFLLTDVEGSTALWERAPEAMRSALARHDDLFEHAIREHGGAHIRPRGEGDSRFAVFAEAERAVAAALAVQRLLLAEPWPTPRPIKVRIGVHTGQAELRDGDYYGSAVNRCARIRGIGHGGQILLSESTAALARDRLPIGADLLDLGEHRLKDLTQPERVSQVTVPDLPSRFPALVSLDAHPHNLPIQPTALLGREREVIEVRTLFQEGTRLVTLTGPGGTGKTRLGLQVAAELVDNFDHGASLVELAPIVDPALVPSTIAQALGVRDMGGRTVLDGLKEHLRDQTILLLLDNFEQIVAAAPLVGDLLATSPGLKVLVTSREPLRLRGEREYAVPPLALPDARHTPMPEELQRYAAVALFLERAVAIRADFAVTSANASSISEICARLDGLPLAIELAAARVRLLTPQAMAQRLERRLPLLTGGARDLPTRQQTLRGAIAWSHDLLDDHERRLLRRLAVFVGGWSLEAAEAVCDPTGDLGIDILDGLESLAAKSLLRQEQNPEGEPRFGMLETIREYASEQLEMAAERHLVRRRHAEYYLDLAEAVAPEGLTMWAGQWDTTRMMSVLRPEHDNLRAALDWSRETSVESGFRLVAALWNFWNSSGDASEGRRWLDDLMARAGMTMSDGPWTPARHGALFGGGMLAFFQGDFDASWSLWKISLVQSRQLGDERRVASSLHSLGMVAQYRGEDARALAFLDEAVAMGRQLHDEGLLADALMYRGLASHRAGDYVGARALLEEGLAARRRSGSRNGLGPSLSALGFLALDRGDYATARACFEERLELWRGQGEISSVAASIASLGLLALAEGNRASAHDLLKESLATKLTQTERSGSSWYLACFATLAIDEGKTERAARLAGAASELRKSYGTTAAPSMHLKFEHMLSHVKRATANAAGARAWADGEAMSLEQALAYAMEEPASA
jgi:predicted ATPase/class 3 adenylate cyclase